MLKFTMIKLTMFCLFLAEIAVGQSPILHLNYNESSGTTSTLNQNGGQTFQIANTFGAPERVAGVYGNALRTDGFSTWVSGAFNNTVNGQFTVETWIALESYPSDEEVPYGSLTPSAIVSQKQGNNGFAIGINTFGNWWFEANISGQLYKVSAPNNFPLYEWVHIAGVIDASSGKMSLVKNGVEIASTSIPTNGLLVKGNASLIIGKSNIDKTIGIWLLNTLNAAIDETKIYDRARTLAELATEYSTGISTLTTTGEQAIAVPESRFAGDLQRPIFHGMPPASWTNEPHGLVKYNNEYHMFYQRTPNGVFKTQMHWGHMSSTDFVHWKHHKDALWPTLDGNTTVGMDMKGIWSGDVVVENGVAHALYTSVNHGSTFNPGISLAKSSDANLDNWTKYGPVISKQFVNDFRDPYLWKEGNTWHMIIGAALGSSGGLDHYTSSDLTSWTHQNQFSSMPYSQMDIGSVIWEMPVFESLGNGKHILIANPIGGSASKYGPTNYTRAVYWIGTWSGSLFTPDDAQPKKLDVIHGHLSPTVTRNANNQLVGIGMVDERWSSQAQLDAGWCHTYSLPRVYSLLSDNKTLGQSPAPELTSLRISGSAQSFINQSVNGTKVLSASGKAIEIIVNIDPNTTANKYGINLAISANRQEITKLYYDAVTKEVVLDKTNSSLSSQNEESVIIKGSYDELAFGKPIKFHVFYDHSIIDVFINDKAAFSNRIYPILGDSQGIELYSNGTTNFTSVNFWEIEQAIGIPQVPVSVTGVSLSPSTLSIGLGTSSILQASVLPTNATNKGVTWTSSNPAVATVSSSGVVTGISLGNAIITVKTNQGNYTAQSNITVTPTLIFDFESGNLNDWTVTGAAFSPGDVSNVTTYWGTTPFNHHGTYHLWGYQEGGDTQTGSIQTNSFTLGGNGIVNFLVGGGNDINQLYIALVRNSDQAVLFKATGNDSEGYTANSFNAAAYVGTQCYIKVVDNSVAGFGHLNVDNIVVPVQTTSTIPATGVSLNQSSATLNTGGSIQLTATVAPANATNKNVTWSSSNTSVATVNSTGLVSAIAAGTSTITVTTQSGGFTSTAAITVSVATIPVTGVSLNQSSAALNSGGSVQLTATVAPSNATNKNVTWSSSNASVATVNSTGLVSAIAAGTSTITVTTQSGGFTSSAMITVSSSGNFLIFDFETGNLSGWTATGNAFAAGDVTTDVNWGWGGPFNQHGNYHLWGFKVGNGDSDTGSIKSSTFKLGGDGQITFLIGGGYDINQLYFALYSANTDVELMRATGDNNDSEGYIQKSFNASAYIGTDCYVKLVDNHTGGWGHINLDYVVIPTSQTPVTSISLNQTQINIVKGGNSTLIATVLPTNATNKAVTWSSSNTYLATVNATGVISALNAGTVTITSTTVNGGFSANCTVNISEPQFLVYDFETGNLSGWTATGNAFVAGDVTTDINWSWGGPFNQHGSYHLWGFKVGSDSQVGSLKSADFTVGGNGQITFLIGGGYDLNLLYLALYRKSDNVELMRATGDNNNSEAYIQKSFNAAIYVGTECYLKIVDNHTGGWGHINIDNIVIPIIGSSSSRTTQQLDIDDDSSSKDDKISLYPNPAHNEFIHVTWSSSMIKSKGNISVIDLNGRVIFKTALSNSQINIDIDGTRLNAGVYIISLQYDDKVLHDRIIIR